MQFRSTLTKHRVLGVIAAFAIALGATQFAGAASIPYPDSGTPNTATYTFTAATSGDVIAYFAGSTAAYDEDLGMEDNGVLTSAGFGLDDHTSTIGESFDLGYANAGDTLTFVLDVLSPDLGDVYSDPSLNTSYDSDGSDGHQHVYSAAYDSSSNLLPSSVPSGTYVAFEDLPFPGSDFNYHDETYVIANVNSTDPPSAVPEPASLTLLGTGLLGLAGAIRRRVGKTS